ncbi:metal-dependent transcriptional regulator [Natronolimnobius sp. AArcel1]|uniref:metal-dependent transcriptional regulator n=1 Tax=Natronolimnobius sp. AArcel1 TaxID=1679093 RepID=UPI0013EE168E|nr:metal-dependent transcriptional regulator [Natronolimnobius sp. AArcel1]NGM67725.1 metal-dependent transcriptional regulator [Natronolimnobius sp. AArcel1]
MPTPIMEDYLQALYQLEAANGGIRVRTSDLADQLEVAPPTVSSMYATLADAALIDHEKYRGAATTDAGAEVAVETNRNRHLLEAYLSLECGFRAGEAEREADTLEHHISDRFVEAMEERIQNARHASDSELGSRADDSARIPAECDLLADCEARSTVVVRGITEYDPVLEATLSRWGIVSEQPLTVLESPTVATTVVSGLESGNMVVLPDAIAAFVTVSHTPEPSY